MAEIQRIVGDFSPRHRETSPELPCPKCRQPCGVTVETGHGDCAFCGARLAYRFGMVDDGDTAFWLEAKPRKLGRLFRLLRR